MSIVPSLRSEDADRFSAKKEAGLEEALPDLYSAPRGSTGPGQDTARFASTEPCE